MDQDKASEALFEKKFISEAQLQAVKEYRLRGLFSVRYEAHLLFFISVILFTTGAGIFVYNNIGTIGHMAILAIILAVAAVCYYYSFRHAPGFSKQRVISEKPLYDYLALTACLLSGIFVGYLQYQYSVFGTHNDVATLAVAIIYFFCAYYFDHKAVLSMAIAALCTFVGFSASPRGLLRTDFDDHALAWYAMATASALLLWAIYSRRMALKAHFEDVYQNFALHIFCVAALSQMFSSYWHVCFLLLTGGVYYFMDLSFRKHSAYFFSFSFLYGFTGLSFFLGNLMRVLELHEEAEVLITLSPFYMAGAIALFILNLKRVKKK